VHAGFGRRVISLADVAHPTGRRNIYYPAGAGRSHDAACRAGHKKDAGKINRDHLVPLFVCHFVQHGITINPGIVDENVQTTVALVNVLDGSVAFTGIRHVHSHADRALARVARDAFGIGLVDVGTDHDCAFVSQLAGDSLTDAAARACNDCDFVCQQVSR